MSRRAGLGARLRSADYDRVGRQALVALLVPTEDPQRAQGVPPAGPTIAVLEREVDRAGMGVLQKPRPVGLLLGSEQINRFVHPRVRRIPSRLEVLQRTQHV